MEDWVELLKRAFKDGVEDCHGGCGEKAALLKLTGKRIGAFCKGCWSEIAYGRIPKLDMPRGARRRTGRR